VAHPLRYSFILGLVALGTALAAVGGWRYARASAPVNGPIILISVDTLRVDHLAAYGRRRSPTPALDELAAEGVVFERAYSHAAQTLPAHAALLTGRLPFETGVRDDVGFAVKPANRLLQEMLADRGYSTAGVVSSYALRKETGLGRGFAFFDGHMQPAAPEMSIGELRRDGAESERLAEHWLDQSGTSRAFLFLHLYEPHKPYTLLERYADYEPYDAAIAYADEIVGRLIRYLKAHQLYDHSTIILLSDHGEGLGDHGEDAHGLLAYDEVLHIPLIVKEPAAENAGRRVRDVVELVDVVPTVLDLAKAPIPGDLPGRSFKPLLDGARSDNRLVYAESLYGWYHFGASPLVSITDGRYRYIEAPRPELYDIERDPGERRNLLDNERDADGARVAARLHAEVTRVTKGRQIRPPSQVTPEDRQRLAALGVVGDPRRAEPAADRQDPKDLAGAVDTYRAAVEHANERQWPQALKLLQQIVRDHDDVADVWDQIASIALRAGRLDQALDAYRHLAALHPEDPAAHIGAAEVLLRQHRLDEARREASLVAEGAGEGMTARSVHDVLARIALARHDTDGALSEAGLAEAPDQAQTAESYVRGRLAYDHADYEEAVGYFSEALARPDGVAMRQTAELHFYLADALAHLNRTSEAEDEFLQELKFFPQTIRAWTSLATLYHRSSRGDEAQQTIADLLRENPTPEAYAAAARFWTAVGDRHQAQAVRAEGLRQAH
jgi:arylsulfatase A-like enzyme/predicted Zn-dependent protease